MSDVTPVLVPRMNPNDEHAVLVCWHVASGAWVEAAQTLATVETTKATYDVESPCAGYAFFEQAPESMVVVGAAIAFISARNERPEMRAAVPPNDESTTTGGSSRFTRKALQLMARHRLVEADFPPSGRIGVAEVEQLANARGVAASEGQAGALRKESRGETVPPAAAAAADDDADADAASATSTAVEPLRQSSAKILEVARLSAVYAHAIPSTVAIALSCAALDARSRELSERLGPVSALELAIHGAARVLPEFPELNGFYADGRAVRYTDVHVGFAVNLGKALRVPVVRGAASLSLPDVVRTMRDLSLRYLRGELSAADVADGTFTVTDLSARGVVSFVPVLNYRQAAILGICAERPGTGHRELVLTFDHRMADGMQAAAFLGKLRDRLVSGQAD